MSQLSERQVSEREQWFTVGQYEFLVRRPAKMTLAEKAPDRNVRLLVCSSVVDWRNVSEGDLIHGASDRKIPFDADACEEWLSDRPKLFAAVLAHLYEMVEEYDKRLEELEKNLD